MPTEARRAANCALFLFCHQDDEFGVYQQILLERSRGRRILCAYLTSGTVAGGDPARRDAESLAVLNGLGVAREDVQFVGSLLAIADGRLLDHLPLAAEWLRARLSSLEGEVAIYVPAWEGGHPDHDALHFLCIEACAELGMLPQVRQFPLYNAMHCPWKLFRVASPLAQNGPVESSPIPWVNRIRFLRCSLGYPSQWRSWLGLFPFYALHLLICGTQELQQVSRERVHQPPHGGPLYYERRRFSSWAQLRAKTQAWQGGRSA
jgi:LmbE family N-acetylglucosaminyl deacetylase